MNGLAPFSRVGSRAASVRPTLRHADPPHSVWENVQISETQTCFCHYLVMLAPVRESAKESLRKYGAHALDALLHGLNQADANVAQASAELLGELGRPEAVQPLLVALKYSQRPVQLAAKRALARLGPVAKPDLEAARGEPQPWVRAQIEEVLAQVSSAPPIGPGH